MQVSSISPTSYTIAKLIGPLTTEIYYQTEITKQRDRHTNTHTQTETKSDTLSMLDIGSNKDM